MRGDVLPLTPRRTPARPGSSASRCRNPSAPSATLPGHREDLPGLRLPLPLHRGRRRTLVPQPGRARWSRRATTSPTSRGASGRAEHRPGVPGVRVVVVSPADELYVGDRRRGSGRRCASGPACSGTWLRNRRRYDVVHLRSFPYFSLLAARAALAGAGVPIGVDWFEVWSREYWRDYLGRVGGRGRGSRSSARACWPRPRAFCVLRRARCSACASGAAPRRGAARRACTPGRWSPTRPRPRASRSWCSPAATSRRSARRAGAARPWPAPRRWCPGCAV